MTIRADRHVQARNMPDSAVPAFGSALVRLVPALGWLIPYDRQIPGSPGYGAQRLIHALASVHSDAREATGRNFGSLRLDPKVGQQAGPHVAVPARYSAPADGPFG